MNVHHAPLEMLHKARRENAHEPGQHHQRGVMAVDDLRQFGVEILARGELLVVQHLGGDAVILGESQPARTGFVAHDGGHAGAKAPRPIFLLGCTHNGSHIGATARNEDHDIFHGRRLSHRSQGTSGQSGFMNRANQRAHPWHSTPKSPR
ncbi:hypothetical protein SDC9_170823 [bioreactor metagenome]|uniref:Uncharacterized protein n=1 Tax=bioreactor metagenome TaxID=1076179 RepID=A0A645G9W6_9ZZZZ